MKIVLINPPFFDVYKGYEVAAKIGACYPPTGLLYLGAKLRADGHLVRLFDVDVEGLSYEELIRRIVEFGPDIVGITSTTPLFHKAREIAQWIKRVIDVPVVLGGIHVTILLNEAIRSHPEFDYAVIGEGEITFSELIGCIERGEDISEIPGLLINRPDGEIIDTGRRPLIDNLDELPYPARDLVDKNSYLWVPPHKGVVPIASILTKRGCPFFCSFCSQHSMFTRRVRYRSVENVMGELDEIVNIHGIEHIIFLDDTLVIKRERMMKICGEILKRNLRFTWEGMARANLVDEELIKTMAKAGLVRLSFGIESGNQDVLNKIHKGTTLEQIRTAYTWAKKAGIETRGSAIIGHPGETSKSAWQTIKFLRGLKYLDQVYINIMVPYPGTEVFELAKKGEGGYRLLSDDYSHYIRYNQAVLEINDLDRVKLGRLQNIGLWLFYLTPRRVVYNLRRAGIKNGALMAFAFLRGLLSRPKNDETV